MNVFFKHRILRSASFQIAGARVFILASWLLHAIFSIAPMPSEAAESGSNWRADLVPSSPVVIRSGCANFARKLREKRAVTIAFLGGSITENPGSFAASVPAWLREQHPDVEVRAINAGWGGTGSELGAQRLDREVLVHHPDLVFVEFAVNDLAMPETLHMERIIRKIWVADPETDIVFLYTLSKGDLDFYKKGLFPLSASRHDRVAQHYGVPMIAMAQGVAADVLAGRMEWAEFSHDTCHPHAGGYRRYHASIISAFSGMMASDQVGPHPIPQPYTPGFVLVPPPIVAEPLHVGPGVYPMPSLGSQWVGDRFFPSAEKPLWSLFCQPLSAVRGLAADVGLVRTRWLTDIRWLDGAGFFLGPKLRFLAGRRNELRGCFGSNTTEAGVVVFHVPENGHYRVEFTASGIRGYSMAEKEIGLNIVKFAPGQASGESVWFFSESRAHIQPKTKSHEVTLRRGEEVAFVFLPHETGGAFFTEFQIRFHALSGN